MANLTIMINPFEIEGQMFRRTNGDILMLRKVFENPRVHSNIGYAMKKVGIMIWTFSLSEENIIYCYPLGNEEETREFCKSSTFQSKGHFQALRMGNH